MKIVHVTSDWKWTGPAAPMLTLLRAQRDRGDEVQLVCPPPPGAGTSLRRAARACGVEPALEIARGRGAVGWRDGSDVARLRRLLRRQRFDVVHVWHTRDHVLALRASAGLRRAGLTHLVRSWQRAEAVPDRSWNRWLFGPGTDGLWCVSPGAVSRNAALRSGRPLSGRLGAVDLVRFRPRRPDSRVRAALGIRPEHRVVAIVARAQPQRRFDLLLAAMQRLADGDAKARLLVIGRGTRARELAVAPAARMGLADRVVFAGYRGPDYADVLRAADVFTLLVPGSDGGCRALLEAAACGLPAVTTRRGAMPEIVVHGETGCVVDEDADALAAAWRRLLADPQLRAAIGAARGRLLRLLFVE
ncbi:MAG: glycosyltransferase family 4 protein, partial [Myxococcota bacterium]